jgi:hypothetical protein
MPSRDATSRSPRSPWQEQTHARRWLRLAHGSLTATHDHQDVVPTTSSAARSTPADTTFNGLLRNGTAMTTTTAPATVAPALRRLYFVRFGFALIWAVVLFLTASSFEPLSAILLVIYPLFDVGAAIVDVRSSRGSRSAPGLYINIAISVIAAVGLVFAVASGGPVGMGGLGRRSGPRPAHRRSAATQARRPVGDDRQRHHLDVRWDLVLPAGR